MKKTNKALEKFADMMVKTIENIEGGWTKTWLTATTGGRPVNGDGRAYNRMNEFFLYLAQSAEGYDLPVWLTYNKCKQLGCNVRKGEKAFPVMFWSLQAYNKKTGERISIDDYRRLGDKKDWEQSALLRFYNVFNIAQTDMKETNAGKYAKYEEQNTPAEMPTADGMYANAALDRLIDGGWLCQIHTQHQDRAFYSPSGDYIMLPTKEQFNKGGDAAQVYRGGMEFYATALHEMAHSTGTPERLNRIKGSKFGDEKYAKEELVAELTAALCGHNLGFDTEVCDHNAAYLKCWLKTIKQEPNFLLSVLADVSKAAEMIDNAIAAGVH
jgi:antirestriction protein ArdC